MPFVPTQPETAKDDLIFYHQAKEADGWRGMATGKDLNTLQSEVSREIGRLGGKILRFQRGLYEDPESHLPDRDGYVVEYIIEGVDGEQFPGELQIAALPCDPDHHRDLEGARKKSLKMALFMMRDAIAGTRFLEALSPGYVALMPWMIEGSTGKTLTQLWSDGLSGRMLPSPDSSFKDDDAVEGSFEEK